MTITSRDKEKLRAIGIFALPRPAGVVWEPDHPWMVQLDIEQGDIGNVYRTEDEAWDYCKHYATTEGLRSTMADKVRWLMGQSSWLKFQRDSHGFFLEGSSIHVVGESPEAAVDALLWLVP